jgi:antirestriction protein
VDFIPQILEDKMKNDTVPKIYVACLAAYNNGYLHGRWIDIDKDVEAINREIHEMLAESPIPNAEEFAIHDYDGFGGINVGEYAGIDTVRELAEFIQEHGEELAAGVYNYYGSIDDAKDALENRYHGEYDSELDYAEQLFDECYAHDIPENIRFYIDYEKFSRDLFVNDCFSIDSKGSVHIFSYY